MFSGIRLRYAVNIRVIRSCFYIYVLLDSVHLDKNSEFLIFWDYIVVSLLSINIYSVKFLENLSGARESPICPLGPLR